MGTSSFIRCLLPIALSLVACGDDTSSTGSGGGGGGTTTSTTTGSGGSTTTGSGGATTGSGGSTTTGTGGGGSLCDTIDPSPNTIPETQLNTTYPTPAGGTIADGTYFLSHFDVYSPGTADNNVRAGRLDIMGNEVRFTRVDNGGIPMALGGTFTTNGTTVEVQFTCPAALQMTFPYTATATELWLFDPTDPDVQIFTKQ